MGRMPPSLSDDLRVPMRRARTTVVDAAGARRDVTVFLDPEQCVADLLDGGRAFLPVVDDDRVVFLATMTIACLSARAELPAADGSERALRVRVRLASGETLEGDLRYLPVPGRHRALDLLNEDAPSFAVHANDVVHHIVKAHVRHVEEVA